jgi:hypothetical protein
MNPFSLADRLEPIQTVGRGRRAQPGGAAARKDERVLEERAAIQRRPQVLEATSSMSSGIGAGRFHAMPDCLLTFED